MRVTYDLPAAVVWRIEALANESGCSPVDIIVGAITRPDYLDIKKRVELGVKLGFPDAEIAQTLHYTVGRIAGIRRSLGLKPNHRYRKDMP